MPQLRCATAEDAPIIARHRGLMFLDMGSVTPEQAEQLIAAAEPWFRAQIEAGTYIGWLVEEDDTVVAGGGVFLRELGPIPGCFRVGRWAHIANVYTLLSHRRRGIARSLMNEMLHWCAVNAIDQVTLAASADGRALYESVGFVETNEMRLAKPLG